MAGRANLFKIKNTISQSLSDSNSDMSTKDSGVGSRSPVSSGEYRRVGRGKLIDELTSSCSHVTISGARGRARIFEAMESYTSSTDSQVLSSGRGRAKILESIQLNSTTEPANVTTNNSRKEEVEQCDNADEKHLQPVIKHGIKGN